LHTHIHNKIKSHVLLFLIFVNNDACFDKRLFHRGADVITWDRGEGGR
jgi:hypothetical protein